MILLAQLEAPLPSEAPLPLEAPILAPQSLLSLPVQGLVANIVCDYNYPKDYLGKIPTTKQDSWNYASSSCHYYSYSSSTNGFTYGDLLTNFFLFLIIIGLTFGFILKRTIKKR